MDYIDWQSMSHAQFVTELEAALSEKDRRIEEMEALSSLGVSVDGEQSTGRRRGPKTKEEKARAAEEAARKAGRNGYQVGVAE
jgi:hypothetical protein